MIGQEVVYGPCPCGSGRKFKFCCYKKYRHELNDDMNSADVAQLVRCGESGINDDGAHDQEAWALHDDAIELMKAHRLEEARSMLRRAREIDPAFGACWNNEASCAWHLMDWRSAYEIQKEGLDHVTYDDTFSFAALSRYALGVGKVDEAEAAIGKARAKLPLSIYDALEVCKALACFHRHREILDYVARSGMGDSPRVAFFTGVAHANLKEHAAARTDLEKAAQSEFGIVADEYCIQLDDGCEPATLGDEKWPYFSRFSFPPAALFFNDIEDGNDPLKSCPEFFALDCINILSIDDACSHAELRKVLSMIKGEAAERMQKALDETDWGNMTKKQEAKKVL